MESQGHPPIAPSNKKAKTKKAADPNETSKLLAAKISQLESDAAGEKDQEAEIGKWQNTSSCRPHPPMIRTALLSKSSRDCRPVLDHYCTPLQ